MIPFKESSGEEGGGEEPVVVGDEAPVDGGDPSMYMRSGVVPEAAPEGEGVQPVLAEEPVTELPPDAPVSK